MSPRGLGSRIRGTVAGLPARAGRAATRLDPRELVIRHRHVDVFLFVVLVLGAVALGLSAMPALSIVVGLPPLAFILLVIIRAYRANVARRREVKGEIDDARHLVRQGANHLRLLAKRPDDRRARLILSRLSSGIRLLITHYRKCLDEDAVGAAMTAERLVLDAEIAEAGEIGGHVVAISRQLDIAGNGILDADDPRVSGELGRI